MKKFIEEFKKFLMRGNVIDLAVGVIIGGAFTAIVTSLTTNFLNPLLSFVMTGNAGNLGDTGVEWSFGGAASAFITALVNFVITAFVLFCIVKAVNSLAGVSKKKEAPAAPTTKKCPYCLSDIPIKATRCPHCTSEQPAEKA